MASLVKRAVSQSRLSSQRGLALILLAFALLAGTYSAVTPLYEAPDEVWHDAYVRWLAQGHGLPPLDEDVSGAYQEAAQPPLYYAVAAGVRRFFPDPDRGDLLWHNPNFGYQAGATVNDNKNMLIHTARESFPWRGAALAVHATRLVSVLFGLLAVAATWGLAREAGLTPGPALAAAALVAFNPQFLFISGVVSNDSATAALATATLCVLARIVKRGVTLRRILTAGLLIGLATLTKTSGLFLGPLALAAVWLAPGTDGARRPTARRLSGALLLGGTAAAVGGGWYLRNLLFYGDLLGTSAHTSTPWTWSAPLTLPSLLAQLPVVYRSFWGGFGWGHVEFPAWVYLALGAVLITSLIGWIWALRTRRLDGHTGVLLLAAAWCALVGAALMVWMRQVYAAHGRLLFPAIGAWALLTVAGWSALPGRSTRWVVRAGLAGLGALSLLTPWTVIRPAFAPPRLMDPVQAAASVDPAGLVYDGALRLLGVDVERASVVPGGTLRVRACWEALAPVARDYTLFIHLVGRDNVRVAERYTYPGLGRFPTTLWPLGQAFCDDYRMQVEAWAPVPEQYDLWIGMYDNTPDRPAEVRDLQGARVESPVLGRVWVAPARPLPVAAGQRADYRLGDAIALSGYQLSGPLQGGAPLTVTLYWRALGSIPEDYTAFVHLLDDTGQQIAQHDGPPRYGRAPTSAWQVGDVVPDAHVLVLPALPPGRTVRLVVGMYHPGTLERLAVVGPDGSLPDDLIPLMLPALPAD